MLGASHAAFGTSIWIMPPPPSADSVVGGSAIPQAWSIPLSVLPLAVYTTLPHTCTWPVPPMEASPADQVTLTIRCEASAYVVRGAHSPPPVPPVPVVPAVPAAPDAPAAPSGLTSELLLDPQAPASASSAASAVLRPVREPDTMSPAAENNGKAHPLATSEQVAGNPGSPPWSLLQERKCAAVRFRRSSSLSRVASTGTR